MRQINSYIIEKLKLNKDISDQEGYYDAKEGERVLLVKWSPRSEYGCTFMLDTISSVDDENHYISLDNCNMIRNYFVINNKIQHNKKNMIARFSSLREWYHIYEKNEGIEVLKNAIDNFPNVYEIVNTLYHPSGFIKEDLEKMLRELENE